MIERRFYVELGWVCAVPKLRRGYHSSTCHPHGSTFWCLPGALGHVAPGVSVHVAFLHPGRVPPLPDSKWNIQFETKFEYWILNQVYFTKT